MRPWQSKSHLSTSLKAILILCTSNCILIMLTKWISARNTETITTPIESADRPPLKDCKRYVELLMSVVDVRGMKIALYPSGCTTVNILYGRDQSRELCHFCPSAATLTPIPIWPKVWCRYEQYLLRDKVVTLRTARTIFDKIYRTTAFQIWQIWATGRIIILAPTFEIHLSKPTINLVQVTVT